MTVSEKPFRFPKKFLWGVSTSAHQVEGGNHNNWTVWELDHAKTLAAQAQFRYARLDNWNDIKEQATNPHNYVSGMATRHYDFYEHDFDLAKKMNMNTFRFSIEWSRVEPEEGAWSVAAIEHYKRYVQELRARGLEPVVTLWHYTLPIWFAKMDGFEKRSNVKYFTRYAEKIISELGVSVRYVLTINEPEVYITESYVKGSWPPNKNSLWKAYRVANNLIYAHNKTSDALRKQSRRYKVAYAKNSVYYYAGDDAWLSRLFASILQYVQDDYLLKRTYKKCDFLGVNYYFANRVYGYRVHNPTDRVNDLGWDMNPQALQQALERLHDKYHKPIIVTENGVADAGDHHRRWWLSHTLIALQRAMEYGVDVRGYIHWSLLDNIELDKGRWPRFGLFAVDYETFKRTPRPSALWYAKVVKKLRSSE